MNLFSGLILLSLLLAFPAKAGGGGQFLYQLNPYLTPAGQAKIGEIQALCQSDKYCMAQHLLAHIKGPAQIRKISHPGTNSIRRARNLPSVGRARPLAADHLYMSLDRFGRNAPAAILALCQQKRNWRLITLDLRKNEGGDPMRMLKIAALFSMPAEKVFYAKAPDEARHYYAIPEAAERCHFQKLVLLIGAKTASSAELLAGLLRSHARASLWGRVTYGKNFLYRLIPLNHDWRLYMPAEKIVLPGRQLQAGIAADGPIPPRLREQLEF